MESITGTRFYNNGVRVDGGSLVQPAAMMRGLAAATGVLVVPPQGDAQLLPLPWS